MPLRGSLTEWLWAKPLPCYASRTNQTANVLAIMSAEFTGYSDLITRMKALLSAEPVTTLAKLQNQSQTQNHQPALSSSPSSSSSTSSATTLTNGLSSTSPLLFTVPQSAHLSQSDFGPLFPYLNRRFLKVDDPDAKIQINTRAILQAMRMSGAEVGSVLVGDKSESAWDEKILSGDGSCGLVRLGLDA
jgi:platelet-activating factor acetylhydrolase